MTKVIELNELELDSVTGAGPKGLFPSRNIKMADPETDGFNLGMPPTMKISKPGKDSLMAFIDEHL